MASLNPQGWPYKLDPLLELGTDDDGFPVVPDLEETMPWTVLGLNWRRNDERGPLTDY